MANELAALSNELAAAVERAGKSVAAVHARPRFSSSGVFWKQGVIVTAEHAIRREDEITVTLPDGKNAPAVLVGSDPGTDLAVLKVDFEGAPVQPAKAAPVPGNLALAIGRSEDSGVNATMGIVSAVSGSWRTWRGGRLDHYIRLDLTMHPGSTGGLVIDVSCGTGIFTRQMQPLLPAGTPIVGVEPASDMRHKAAAMLVGAVDVTYYDGMAEKLPTATGFRHKAEKETDVARVMGRREDEGAQPRLPDMDRLRDPRRIRLWLGVCAGMVDLVEADDHVGHRSRMRAAAIPLGRPHRSDAGEFRAVGADHAGDRCLPHRGLAGYVPDETCLVRTPPRFARVDRHAAVGRPPPGLS